MPILKQLSLMRYGPKLWNMKRGITQHLLTHTIIMILKKDRINLRPFKIGSWNKISIESILIDILERLESIQFQWTPHKEICHLEKHLSIWELIAFLLCKEPILLTQIEEMVFIQPQLKRSQFLVMILVVILSMVWPKITQSRNIRILKGLHKEIKNKLSFQVLQVKWYNQHLKLQLNFMEVSKI